MFRIAKRTRRNDIGLHREVRKVAKRDKLTSRAIADGAGINSAEADLLLHMDGIPRTSTLTKAAEWLGVEVSKFVGDSQKFYIFFRDHLGLERRVPATSDKRTSSEFARQLERVVNVRKTASEMPPELISWVENLPPEDSKRLVDFGLIEPSTLSAAMPIADHLAAWLQHIRRNDRTDRHLEECDRRVAQVLEAAGVKHWSAINAGRIMAAIDALPTRGGRPMSSQNRNKYIAGVKSFARFMVETDRAKFNPLTRLKKSVAVAKRRRALSRDEIPWLLEAARVGGPFRFNTTEVSGADRLMIYLVELSSGLRANAIGSLCVRDFKLTDRVPHIHVPARLEKNRCENKVPLSPELAEALQRCLKMKTPSVVALNVPPPGTTARMVREDLEAAKAAYVAKAENAKDRDARARDDFLAVKVDGYLPFDFHSMRVTASTRLQEDGVPVGFVQRILNHKTLALTLDNYNRPSLDTLHRAVAAAEARGTGTGPVAR